MQKNIYSNSEDLIMHSTFHEKLKSFVTTDNAKQLQSITLHCNLQLKNVLNSKKMALTVYYLLALL